MKTLREIQVEADAWQTRNFGDVFAYQAAMGVVEELGELAHAQLKMEQGIRGTEEEHLENARDAVGDTMIFLLNMMSKIGWDVDQLMTQYRHVRHYPAGNPRPAEVVLAASGSLGRVITDVFVQGPPTIETVGHGVRLIRALETYCQKQGWDFTQVVNEVWSEVSQRDWVTHPTDGGCG